MPISKYVKFPDEQRYMIQVWKWQSNSLEEYGRCGTFEEAEKLLELARCSYSTGRIIEVRKIFTDQY